MIKRNATGTKSSAHRLAGGVSFWKESSKGTGFVVN
jgi:hypothetical protein